MYECMYVCIYLFIGVSMYLHECMYMHTYAPLPPPLKFAYIHMHIYMCIDPYVFA